MAYQPEIGSVSWGTMRDEDLLPAFADELENCVHGRHGFAAERKLVKEARRAAARVIRGKRLDEDDFIFEALYDALNEFAPPYCYFGPHLGDGADYGFWPLEDCEQMARDDGVPVVSDLGELPSDYRGEAFQVSDHGNLTLYAIGARGKAKEIWSIV